MKRLIKIGLPLLILLILLIIGGSFYWKHKKMYPSTDNAYVNAPVINVASRISGAIIALGEHVQDHAHLKQGALLFDIDPRPFEIAVTKAKANLNLVKQQMQVDDKVIQAAQAHVIQRQAELDNAESQTQRILQLTQQKVVPLSKHDEAVAHLKIVKAALDSSKSDLQKAIAIRGELGDQNTHLKFAKTALEKAEFDLQHTHVIAPASGYLANFHLRVGEIVTASQPLFALIEDEVRWVDANFKEEQLLRIKPEQMVAITLDMYPGIQFKGKVQSISIGSGTSFSLFPPENATGNWVKVTQRFPVKIKILAQDSNYPLRLGASSTVVVDTRK